MHAELRNGHPTSIWKAVMGLKAVLCGAVSMTSPLPASSSPSKVMSASYMRTSQSASGSSVDPIPEAASSGRLVTKLTGNIHRQPF